jgi:single-strand DNA-binding protein
MAARAVQVEVGAQADQLARNEVVLVGRVSGAPEERELPSGDVLVSFRVVVARPPGQRSGPSGRRPTTIDALDCVVWSASARRTARSLADGDVVALEGALRRRFWRGATGAASRTEVEVTTVRRLRRPKVP